MKWPRLFQHRSPEDEARQAEEAAEAGARRRLLALARELGWPMAVVHTGEGYQIVAARRHDWEKHCRAWTPAIVARVLQRLSTEHATLEHGGLPRSDNGRGPFVGTDP
jgi:sugar phosphate isomerase/epimerase